MMRGMLGDSIAYGMAPEPNADLLFVSCAYVIDSANRVARLASGPEHEPGELGCRETLTLTEPALLQSGLNAEYTSDGRLVEINGHLVEPDDPVAIMIQSWDLASPRPGRTWPGLPSITIRIVQ